MWFFQPTEYAAIVASGTPPEPPPLQVKTGTLSVITGTLSVQTTSGPVQIYP